jgi:hypothetical protein
MVKFLVDPRDKRHRVEQNEAVSEDVEVEPKDHTTTPYTKAGLAHKPDTKEDLYLRRERRSKEHI